MIVTYLTSCKEEHAHFNAVVWLLFFVVFVCVFRLKKSLLLLCGFNVLLFLNVWRGRMSKRQNEAAARRGRDPGEHYFTGHKPPTFPASTTAGRHSHRAEGSSPQGRTLLVSIHLTSYTGQRRSRSVCWVQDVRSARAPTKTVIISSSFSGLSCCISTEP